jgi:molybdopterin/thiamine biosynthesis adenylyltransferase
VDHASLRRYSRQILVPEIGLEGQERLIASSVVVVGAGGLGSSLLLHLAAAGVGRITLAEDDVVDPSNLQRQVLYGTSDVGRSKAEVASERLHALNPSLDLRTVGRLTRENASGIFAGHDLVVDATDNFTTRYAINDTCVGENRVWVWGAAQGTDGMACVFGPDVTLRDAFPGGETVTDDCDTIGVLGPLLAVVGGIMAVEATKFLAGLPVETGRLWTYDALGSETRVVRLPRRVMLGEAQASPSITDGSGQLGV